MSLEPYKEKRRRSRRARALTAGIFIGFAHFCATVLLSSELVQEIGPNRRLDFSDKVITAVLFFPASLVMLFDIAAFYAHGLVALVTFILNSGLWGWIGSRRFIRD